MDAQTWRLKVDSTDKWKQHFLKVRSLKGIEWTFRQAEKVGLGYYRDIMAALERSDWNAVSNIIQKIPPTALSTVLFMRGEPIALSLIEVAAQRKSIIFFNAFNQRYDKLSLDAASYVLAERVASASELSVRLTKQIIKSQLNVSELFTTTNSPFRLLFNRFLDFETVKEATFKHPKKIQLIIQFIHFAESAGLTALSERLQAYSVKCRFEEILAGCRIDYSEDISHYVLRELNWNILHQLAHSTRAREFLATADSQTNSFYLLCKEFNNDSRLPTDIALRTFSVPDIERVLQLAQKSPHSILSCSALNNLLSNKLVYRSEDSLYQLIRTILEFLPTDKKGFKDRAKLKLALVDSEGLPRKSCVIKTDSQEEFPLLKYIRNSNTHRKDIMELLWEDTFSISTTTHSNLLMLNQAVKKAIYLRRQRKFQRQLSSKIYEMATYFDVYTVKLIEAALQLKKSSPLVFLLSRIPVRSYLQHLGDGASYSKHLLLMLIASNSHKEVIAQLFDNFEQLMAYTPDLSDSSLLKLLGNISHGEVAGAQRFNAWNELLFEVSNKTLPEQYEKRLKQLFKQHYREKPEQLNAVVLRGTRMFFPIDRVEYFETGEKAVLLYKSFCRYVVAEFQKNGLPSWQSSQKRTKSISANRRLSSDSFVVWVESAIQQLRPSPFIEYLVAGQTGAANSLLRIVVMMLQSNKAVSNLIYRIPNTTPSYPTILKSFLKFHSWTLVLGRLSELNRLNEAESCIVSLRGNEGTANKNYQPKGDHSLQDVFNGVQKWTLTKKQYENLLLTLDKVVGKDLTEKNFAGISKLYKAVYLHIGLREFSLPPLKLPVWTDTHKLELMLQLGINYKLYRFPGQKEKKGKKDKKSPFSKSVYNTSFEKMLTNKNCTIVEAVCICGRVELADYQKLLNSRKFCIAAAAVLTRFNQDKPSSIAYEAESFSWAHRVGLVNRIRKNCVFESAFFELALKAEQNEPENISKFLSGPTKFKFLRMFLLNSDFLETVDSIDWTKLKLYQQSYDAWDYRHRFWKNTPPDKRGPEEKPPPEFSPHFSHHLAIFRSVVTTILKENETAALHEDISAFFKTLNPSFYICAQILKLDHSQLFIAALRHLPKENFIRLFDTQVMQWSCLTLRVLVRFSLSIPQHALKLLDKSLKHRDLYRHWLSTQLYQQFLIELGKRKPEFAFKFFSLTLKYDFFQPHEHCRLLPRFKADTLPEEYYFTLHFLSIGAIYSTNLVQHSKHLSLSVVPLQNIQKEIFDRYLKVAIATVLTVKSGEPRIPRPINPEEDQKSASKKGETAAFSPWPLGNLEFIYQEMVVNENYDFALEILRWAEKAELDCTNMLDAPKNKDVRLHKTFERLLRCPKSHGLRSKVYKMIRKLHTRVEVPLHYLLNLARLDENAWTDFNSEPLSRLQYLTAVGALSFDLKPFKILRKRVIEEAVGKLTQDEEKALLASLKLNLRNAAKAFSKQRLGENIHGLANHIQFILQWEGMGSLLEILSPQIHRLRVAAITAFQTNSNLAFLYTKVNADDVPENIFRSSSVTNLDNLLATIPGLLKNGPKQAQYRRILLLQGNPILLESLHKRQLFQECDIPYIALGSLQNKAFEFLSRFDRAKIILSLSEASHFTTLLGLCNQEYAIDLIRHYGLEDVIMARFEESLIVANLHPRRRMLGYLLNLWNSKAQPPSIGRAVSEARKLGLYEYLFVPKLHCQSREFSLRVDTFSIPSLLQTATKDALFLPAYRLRLELFCNIRLLLSGKLPENVRKQFLLPLLSFDSSLCFEDYAEHWTRVLFKIESRLSMKEFAPEDNNIHLQVLEAVAVLLGHYQGGTQKGKVATILLLQDPTSPEMMNELNATFPVESSIVRILLHWIPTNDCEQSRFEIGSDLRIREITYRHKTEQLAALPDELITNLLNSYPKECFWLAPKLSVINPAPLNHFLAVHKDQPSIVFALVLLLSCESSGTSANWMAPLTSNNKMSPEQLLLQLADNNSSVFYYEAKRIVNNLEQIAQPWKARKSQNKDAEKMIQLMQRRFEHFHTELKGKNFEVAMDGFWAGLRSLSQSTTVSNIRVRLCLIQTYHELIRGLRMLAGLGNVCFLIIGIRCGSFSCFEKDWVNMVSNNPNAPVLGINCVVNCLEGSMEAQRVNIVHFQPNFTHEIRLKLFTCKEYLTQRLQLIASQCAKNNPSTPRIDIDSDSFASMSGTEATILQSSKEDIFGIGRFINELQDMLNGSILRQKTYYNPKSLCGDEYASWSSPPPELTRDAILLMSNRLRISHCNKQELVELKRYSPSKIAADLQHYVSFSRRLFEIDKPMPPDEHFTTHIWVYANGQKMEILRDYHSAWSILRITELIRNTFLLVGDKLKVLRVVREDQLIWAKSSGDAIEISFLSIRGGVGIAFEGLSTLLLKLTNMVPEIGFFEFAQKLLHSDNMLHLLAWVVFSIEESGVTFQWPDAMCIMIDFVETNGPAASNDLPLFSSPDLSICAVNYELKDIYLKATLSYRLRPSSDHGLCFPTILKHTRDAGSFVTPARFVSCLYPNLKDVIDIFLKRRDLEKKIANIATLLSKQMGKWMHLVFDFRSLYECVNRLLGEQDFDALRSLMMNLNDYLSEELKPALLQQLRSEQTQLFYRLNVAQLARTLASNIDQPLPNDRNVRAIQGRTSTKEPEAIIRVPTFLREIPMKYFSRFNNCFMVQIYRYSFSQLFVEGEVYVINTSNFTRVISSAEEFNQLGKFVINWVLWVTETLPEPVLREPELAASLFLCDISENFYKFSQEAKKRLLTLARQDEKPSINDWINALPTNISIELTLAKKQDKFSRRSGDVQAAVLVIDPSLSLIKLNTFQYPAQVHSTKTLERSLFRAKNKLFQTRNLQEIEIGKTEFLGSNAIMPAKQKKANVMPDRYGQAFNQPTGEPIKFKPLEKRVNLAQIISNQRPINTNHTQSHVFSRAGERRTDFLKLYNCDGGVVHPQLGQLSFVFTYADAQQLCLVPQKQYTSKGVVSLIWQPVVRGNYLLVINQCLLKSSSEITIGAGMLDLKRTKVDISKVDGINFEEEVNVTVRYFDQFGNIYSDFEDSMEQTKIDLQLQTFRNEERVPSKQIRWEIGQLSFRGIQTAKFSLAEPKNPEVEERLTLKFLVNSSVVCAIGIRVAGRSFERRKQLFYRELEQYNKYNDLLTFIRIDRKGKLLGSLVKYLRVDLNSELSIVFEGQKGADVGGLTRQFYEMVGEAIRDKQTTLFCPVINDGHSCMTFHPQFSSVPNYSVYLEVLGKFIASAILKGELIGVAFADTFVKALQGQPMQFEEFKNTLSNEECRNYDFLRNATAKELQEMEYTFVAQDNGKQVPLVRGGEDIFLTKANLQSYLQLLTNYLLIERFRQPIALFLKGFNSVFPFAMIGKWFIPSELRLLTGGVHNLDPQNVVDLLEFSSPVPMVQEWVKDYIRHSSPTSLRAFLKFMTGVSTLPVGRRVLQIKFMHDANPNKLPLAHTCYLQIEIPVYRSYKELERKLTMAINNSDSFEFE